MAITTNSGNTWVYWANPPSTYYFGGATWYRSPFWRSIQSVTTIPSDPEDPQILYYGTTGKGHVFRSKTLGESGWTRISSCGRGIGLVRDIEVDSNSQVYVATYKGLMKWDGSEWTTLAGLPTDNIEALAIDRSTNPGVLYVETGENGVFVSGDGGNINKNWISHPV